MKNIETAIKSISNQFDDLINREINKAKKDKLIYLKGYNVGILRYLEDKLESVLWSK